jgi:hypothetical protein
MPMQRRHTLVLLGAAFITAAYGAEIVPDRTGLVVHEWGTFTTVAGNDGGAMGWSLLNGTPDLPCFVDRFSPQNVKVGMAMVRMETPVLYFYPRNEMTLSVHVGFPQGWITEWYPKATKVLPTAKSEAVFLNYKDGFIAWDGLKVTPGATPEFPTGKGQSRYYAARNTDSAPIEIAGQHEKMIFYRGIANFGIPLRVVYDKSGALEITNTGTDVVPMAMVFENRGGHMGYRVIHGLKGAVKVEAPELTGTMAELRTALVQTLEEGGLYAKEAEAMVETWRDSWFEEGARVIYIVPRTMVDAVLPLNVSPAPTSVERVFVGRAEVLSPTVRTQIESALAKKNMTSVQKFSRFLPAFVQQIQGAPIFGRIPSASCIE